jgi:hypothetical protein
MKLELEVKGQVDKTVVVGAVVMTPLIDEDYWIARVKVSKDQAVVCFPKFGTIGIGFQVETDWNTNLPYTCSALEIFKHIKDNKGKGPTDVDCVEAITMLQAFAKSELQKRKKASKV